ncbi:MAG: NADP-dependent oxidoreductase [Actinobacteria bacterium]|nr:NADP-dependent oxidoreductase [Actinomycetota bacterium]
MTYSTAIVLASRPNGNPTPSNFRLEIHELPALTPGAVLLRTIYLSLDPYMRGRMNAGRSYAMPVAIDAVMEGATVCEVLESASPDFAPGDIVLGRSGWQTHSVESAELVSLIDTAGAPISTALGILGMPGFAAYAGLMEIGRPKPGETLVVAGATGAVGSAVGQFGRILGARTVGIAGGAAKIAWLEELGFDVALDHRSPYFEEELAVAVPDGIDVYFENVGGRVWNAVFDHLNDFARVPVCGLISQYNASTPPSGPDRLPELMSAINTKRLLVRGFTQRDLIPAHYKSFARDVPRWLADGRLKYREDIVEGLESAPDAFLGMLEGKNFGKLLVRVSEDPTATPTPRSE